MMMNRPPLPSVELMLSIPPPTHHHHTSTTFTLAIRIPMPTMEALITPIGTTPILTLPMGTMPMARIIGTPPQAELDDVVMADDDSGLCGVTGLAWPSGAISLERRVSQALESVGA